MMRRWGSGLVLCAALVTGCGSDTKEASGEDGSGGKDSAVVDGPDAGGGDGNVEADAGNNTGGTRKVVRDGPNCSDDDDATPGTECVGVVSCGGTAQAPEACPLETHACCVSGIPKDSTVNCYAGVDACQGVEVETPCDGPEDCGDGESCCVDPPGVHVTTQCRAPSECANLGATTMCHTSADCPIGLECKAIAEAPWWGTCG